MKSTAFKSVLASVALAASFSSLAQIPLYTCGQDNPYMIWRRNVRALPSEPTVARYDSTSNTCYVPTFQFNIYYGGDFFAKEDSIGILICDNYPNGLYDFVHETELTDISSKVRNYITKNEKDVCCEIRTCYYDSISKYVAGIAESRRITTPIVVRGVQFGDSVYCYDGMRFLASDLDTIASEPSMWFVKNKDNVVREYHVCDGSVMLSVNSVGKIFSGFEHEGMVYEINGSVDQYGIEVTPVHNLFDVEKIVTSSYIPLEYGTGEKIELADGSKIRIVPLKKGRRSVEVDDASNSHVLYIYPYSENDDVDYYTVLGNVTKTGNGFDLSGAGFIQEADSYFETEEIIDENGKLLKDACVCPLSGRTEYFYSWCENVPFLFEECVSLSMGINNLSHFSNFTSTSIGYDFGMNTLFAIFRKRNN